MNIYLFQEDGESFCIQAETMAEAVDVCELNFLVARQAEETTELDKEFERKFYHEQILQSCALVGQLKN